MTQQDGVAPAPLAGLAVEVPPVRKVDARIGTIVRLTDDGRAAIMTAASLADSPPGIFAALCERSLTGQLCWLYCAPSISTAAHKTPRNEVEKKGSKTGLTEGSMPLYFRPPPDPKREWRIPMSQRHGAI